ncbi:MAG TPA: acyl-CoA dehydrogenase family protein [Actinomycetota bacterium]
MAKADLNPSDLLDLEHLLSDEETAVQDTVRGWVGDRVLPEIGDWFEAGEIPSRDLAKELGAMGLLGMHLEGYGTAGASAVMYGLACLELEAGDSGIRSLVSVQGSLAMFPIWKFGSEEQKQEWLPKMAAGEAIGCFGLTEPDFGSNPAGMRASATKDGSDWLLNGTKMWITNGGVADVAIVWARTDDGVRGFIVPTDTPGFTTNDIHKKISLRASVTSELILENVRLPDDAVLPEVTGMKGPLSCLNEARYGIVWGSMGAARACFESALEYAKTRVQFDRPIGGFQLTQRKLVDMAVELHKGLLLALHLGRMKDEKRARPEHVSFGKLNNVREAIEICREARGILGASGVTLEYPVIRHMNNLESVLTYEGTNEVHTLILGKALTGLDAFE